VVVQALGTETDHGAETQIQIKSNLIYMNYRFLGRTGLRVSELCLGAMTFGRENEATEEESRAMMDRFAELGGNFIDTANVYSFGISEEIVGRWLKEKNREDWVVTTKVRFPMGERARMTWDSAAGLR
jgi:aryl-alcohol dehydrogenase-like predicted oxidoreductase